LKQNLPADEVSVATGTFTIYFGAVSVIVSAPQHSSNSGTLYSLYDAAGNPFFGAYGQDEDYYDENGNYVITVGVTAAIAGGPLTFDVINPTYTEELNWSDMCQTTRNSSGSNVPSSTLLFDTGRKTGLDPSDAMALYDIQGLSFQGRNIDTQVFPVANLSHSNTFTRGGFVAPQTYSTATNTIYTQFGAGRCNGSVDPAPLSSRAVDYFTIFRGPGYIRMLGQVADPATGLPVAPGSVGSERDTAYFFGMFRPYEEVTEYPHPMAFLGDIGFRSSGTLANRTRPWWRQQYGAMDTIESRIWDDTFSGIPAGFYTLKAPMILTHDFVMGDASKNTPAQAKTFIPKGATSIGNWKVKGSATTTASIGSKDDSKAFICTEFNGISQSVGWDPVVGWKSPSSLAYQHLESPGGPRVLPITLRQLAGDDHSWTQPGTTNRLLHSDATTGVANQYENIGEIPGMYWANHIQRYEGTTQVPYISGTEFTTGGRTLRMLIGFSQSNAPSFYTAVPADLYSNSGNLMFDMNEL
jgi:hypothetical protein